MDKIRAKYHKLWLVTVNTTQIYRYHFIKLEK